MEENNNLTQLHTALVNKGAVTGSVDDFKTYLSDDKNRNDLFEALKKKGAVTGSFNDFTSWLGMGENTTAASQPTATKYQLPTFQPYQRELDDSPASILSPTQLKIARGEIGEGDTYTLQPGEDIEAFTPLPNFTLEQTDEERQQRQQQPKPQRQTMRDGGRMLGHNAALTRLAQDNGIATEGFENLNELGEDAMKIYALTPQGKADKQNMDNAAELAYDDFAADYLKNGSDQEIKAQLELGRQKQILEQENAALAKDIEAWKAHPGTEQQLNALNARIRDLNKRLGEYEAAVAQSDKAQEKVNEAFQKWLENDDYYKAVAQQYEQNYEATMGDWFDSAATPLYMQMTKDEIAKMKAYLDDESLNLDHRQRTAIKRRVKDAEAWVKAAEKNGWLDKTFAGMQGKGAGIDIATMFRGMGNAIDFDLLDFGIGEAIDDATLRRISEKVRDQGEASLTPEERAVLLSDEALGLTKSVFNVDESAWNAGANTAEMLPFIVELWLSGGANAAIKAGVKGAVKGGAKGFRQGLKAGWKAAMKPTASQLGRLGEAGRFAPKSVGQVAKEARMTAAEIVDNGLFYALTTGSGHTISQLNQYMTPEIDANFDFGTGKWDIKGIAVDEDGNIKGGDKFGIAALKAIGMQAIEGGSEMLGEKALQPLLDRGGYWLRGMMGRQGRAMYKPYLRVVDDWIGHGALKNISGFGTEYAEELAGSVMRVITGLSTWDQEFNKQNLADTAYGLMPAQVAFAILGGGRMVGHARRSSQARDLLDKYAPEQAAFYDRVAQMSTYDGADMLDRKTLEILKTIDEKKNNGTLTEEDQRKAAAELGMIFTMQEQIYMDEASAYMKDKQGRRMYEGITSNINDNGMFTVYEWNHDGTTERVPVLSTKDGKATIRLWNGKKQTVDLKDLSFVGEYTPEQAMQFAGERQTEFDDYAYTDQTTPMAGSVYYDAEGNIPIVPGKGEVNITEVADNGDVTFTTEDGTTQTINERQFYDYMRTLRDAYEVTAGELAAWRVEADTKGKTAAQNDDPQAHYGVGREARMARRALANAIGEERMAELERMDGEQLTREYMMADEKTQDLMYDWMQNRVGDSYGEAMNQRRQKAITDFKEKIGITDNGNIGIATYEGNTVAVESDNGDSATVIDMMGNKTMVPSSSLTDRLTTTVDSFATQATRPQQMQIDALEQAYNGTTFQAGQEHTIGTDTNGEERKAIIVSVNEDGTISYATEYGYDKEGNPTPAARSVKVATAEGFRDMTENARQQRATQAQGQQEAAQQRADMGELRNGQRVTIMDGGHPVQGTVNMPYTGSQSVFTYTQKLIKFDTIDDLKKSMQDAANALQAEQQAAIEAVANRINELANAMPNASIKVVTDINELRPDAQELARKGQLEAYFDPDTNTVVFYAPGLVANNSNVDGKVIHEVVIHYGLRNMLGKKDYAALCLNIFNNVMDDNDRAQYVQYVKDSHPDWKKTMTNAQIMEIAADEWLAFTYENRDIDSIKRESLLQTIVNFIVDLFKKAGVDLNREEVMAELDQLVAASRDWLRGEQVNQEEKKEEAPKEEEKKEEPQPEPTKTREELIANAVQAAANFAAQGDPNFVKDNLDKAKKRVSNAKKRKPTSTDPAKRQEQIEKINTELAAAENELAFWNDVQAVIDEAQLAGQTRLNEADQALQDLDGNLNPTIAEAPVTKEDKEPANGLEFIADQLTGFAKKEYRINKESLKKETGWGDEEAKRFAQITSVDGGMSVQEMAEYIYGEAEIEGHEHGWFKDPMDARDQLLDLLQTAGDYDGITSYIAENSRRTKADETQMAQQAMDYEAHQLGYANAQDMHDKRMAEAQAKLEELKDEQGNLSEEALQQFKDFTEGLMIGQEETPTETPAESIEEGGEYYQPTNEEAPFSVVTGNSSEEEQEETYFGEEPRYSFVTDPQLLEELNNGKTVKVYRAMQMQGGRLYPPMAGKVNGQWQKPIELGVWEQADEHPELVDKNGKFKLDKGNGTSVAAAYNPYLHTSRSPLNDQFSSAWNRPELVTVEVEVPESELTSGYKADKAKDAVGEVEWKSGPVSGQLAKLGNPRKVILSRYDKPVRIVPNEEVAQRIAEMMKDADIEVPFNTVTPELRQALEAQGVKIGKPQKGNAGDASMDAYNEWKNGGTRYSVTGLITNEQGEIDYDKVTNLAENITNDGAGVLRMGDNNARMGWLSRIPQVYQRASGVPATAAAIIARRSYERTGEQIPASTRLPQAQTFRAAVRGTIKEWAKDQGYWYDEERLTEGFNEREGGKESRVFRSEDGSTVRKLTSFTDAYPMGMQQLMESVGIFNTVFPESAYNIIGFGEDSNGELAVVVEQPFVEGKTIQKIADENGYGDEWVRQTIARIMASRGFGHENRWNPDYITYYNGNVGVSDMHGENIILDNDGVPHIIDAVTSLNAGLYDDSNILYSVVTPQQDADYMDAVRRGDMETAQRMVMEAAKAAMPNTKVVDENGNPLVVYHGRSEQFNTFERRKGVRFVMGLEDEVESEGFFFTPDKDFAEQYAANAERRRGGRRETIPTFLNIENPLDLAFTDNFAQLYEEVTGYEYQLGMDDITNLWEIMDIEGMADKIKAKGYDGVIFAEERAEDGTVTEYSYCVFDPSQIKSADPVTYDDEGNVIPLSERFNERNEDIRYSVVSPESQAIFDKAKEIFGTTSNINEAGYILPDGAMLDFSGRKDLDEGTDDDFLRGRRTEDHRDIGQIAYEKDGNTPSGVNTDMPDFIRRGAIRIDSNAGVINLAVKPTQQQRWPIRRIVEANDGDVQVDFGDGWDSDHYVEYDGAKPSRVLADIDRYFDEGVKPEGNLMFSVKKSEKDIADKQLSLFLQNNSGEYETQDGQTIGFASLLNGTDTANDSGARPDTVQREDRGTDPTDYRLRKLEEGETCHVERRYVETQGFDFTGSEKIETTDDVAYIFKQLENAAIENSFVVLIKDGTPTVIHTGIGTYDQTIVNLNNAMVAYQKLNPDKVYFVHNHPSGNIVASPPDKRVYANAKKLFGDKLQPGIIIDTTSGLYGTFTDTTEDMDNVIPKEVKNETPIKTYSFSKQVFEEDWEPSKVYPIKSSNDVATFVSSHRLGEHKKMSLLILTPQHNVIGNIFLPYTSLSEAPQGIDFANEVGYYINQMGGVTAILYGNFRFDSATIDKIKELKDGLKIQGLNLTDCIHISPTGDRYKSAIEARLLSENEAEYDRLTDEQSREILSKENADTTGDPVLYSVSQAANTPQERLRLYDAMVGTKEVSSFVGRVTEGFYQSVVDGAIPLKRLQDVIAGRGKVTDAENAYLMEIARAARAKRLTDEAETKYYEPMMKAIAALTGRTSKKGYYKAMRDVELYVLAKSGLERNKWFWDEAKKSDPNAQLEDKSGLTALAAEFGEKDFTAFAERLVADYEARHGQQKIDELWKCINAVSKNILDTELDGHLISQELHDDLLNRWKFYVPMRGFDEQVTSAFYTYQPSSATIRFENPFKKIKGRVSLADNPFVNLIRMTESAINLKGKNEVGLALLNLAASHDDNGLLRVGKAWEVKEVDPATGEVTWKAAYPNLSNVSQADIPAAIDAFQKAMMRQAKTGDARPSSRTAGGVRIHPSDIDQHVLKVKVGGQTVDLYLLGNPKAFQALNPTGKSKAGEKLSGLTRSLSGLMTTYNPVFMVRNPIWDLGTAMIITYTRDGAAGMANMLGQWFGNANNLRKLIKGKPSGNAKIDQYWNEFLEFGGETGFTRSLNMEKQREDFNKKMRNLTRDKSGQAMHKITHWYFDWMENYGNRFTEDITRFAVFCASRNMGKSAMQAAADAKNTTANFNKKGQSGFARFMSTNFAFFNAAIQGLNTSFHAFKDNPGRAATAAVSTMIYSMAIPFVNMCLLAMFGDDDDWRQYENMTQFVSNTHAVFYIPDKFNLLGKQGFLTIPYPKDFVPFTSLGNIIWRNAAGFEKPLNGRSIFGNVMLQWFDTWADLLPVNAFEEGFGEMKDWKGVARALAPTWLSPVADVMLNRNFMGSQIRRKHFTLNDQKDLAPYWAEYDRSKNWWAHDIARLIAGGDEYRAAAAWRNVDPRQLIHLVEGYGGGTVKLVSDIAVYFEEMAKGDKPTLNQAPFIKKFWIQPNPDKYEGNLNGKLYEMAKYQRELEQQIKDLQKEADKAREDGNDKAAEKREKKIKEIQNSMEYKILTDYDVNGMMKDWREERNDITNDETLSEEGKQDKIVTLTYQKAAFLDGIWEEAFVKSNDPEAPEYKGKKSNWFSEFYYDKKGEQE